MAVSVVKGREEEEEKPMMQKSSLLRIRVIDLTKLFNYESIDFRRASCLGVFYVRKGCPILQQQIVKWSVFEFIVQ